MCFMEWRIAVAVWEEATSGLSPSVCSDVKVPGKITKPASRILGVVLEVYFLYYDMYYPTK
jgi:hypothetical protein